MASYHDSRQSRFRVGQILTFKLQSDEQATSPPLQLRIKRLRQPWTLSCGMVVEVLQDPQNRVTQPIVFLKLYDRRFAAQLRKDNKFDDWSGTVEQSYADFAWNGGAESFLQRLHDDKGFGDEDDKWDAVENETFLAWECTQMFEAEVAAYQRLLEHQGRLIPRLVSVGTLEISTTATEPDNGKFPAWFATPGILIEYIEGFSLAELDSYVPEHEWETIVRQAIRIVHVLGDNNILNRDVCPGNFLITPPSDQSQGYKVVMIDFALCRFRADGESDEEWGRSKWIQDEEGAVGYVMRNRLRRIGYQLAFEHSMRYVEWAEGEE